MKETQVAQRFKKLLMNRMKEKKIPYFYYKIPDTLQLGGKKPFDAFLLVTGKFIAIEFKIKGKKPTEIQQYHLNAVNKAGGHSLIIDETNYKEYVNRIMRGAEITNRAIKALGPAVGITGTK